MEAERYRRVREIFTAALDREVTERSAFIEDECAGDADLRREVESLFSELATSHGVSLDDGPGHRLREAVQSASEEVVEGLLPTELPESVGDYRVTRCLGEGGMGVVYEAEQQQPRRRVAVKVLRPGYATESLVKRFRLEAELLGRLQHPGIARVYEAGEGRPWGGNGPEQPFLVMEFVDGSPLTAWASRRKLDLAARLELLAKVCDGVQHAHERGVVHRDLKPANVLVDSTGQPRILDFGVARALDADVAMGTAHTATSQLIGTLPYMSPEQLGGNADELGPLSDVYALGVLAYELLAGRLPLQLAGLPLGEAIDRVQDVDPLPLGRLDERLGGDVEAIVSKALEKEPHRRYASAAEMAADIRRHLSDEPIQARPQSAIYRATKFVRRNRRFVSSIAALIVVLFSGVAATTYLAIREARARHQAEDMRDDALRATYRAQLGAAFAALRDGQAEAAQAHLDGAPEAMRGWTWEIANARVDDSVIAIALDVGKKGRLVGAGNGTVVAYGPNGLAVLRLERGRPTLERTLEGEFVGLSPDGRRALEETGDSWRVHELSPGPAAAGTIGDVAILADGSWLVRRVRSVTRIGAGGERLHEFPGDNPSGTSALAAGADASWLLLVEGGQARLVDPLTGRGLVDLGAGALTAASGRDKGRVLVVRVGSLERINLSEPDAAAELLLPSMDVTVGTLSRAPSGPLLYVVDESLVLSTWDLTTQRRAATLGTIDYGVPPPFWSPDGERLLVSDRTGVVRVVDARTGRRLRPWLVGQTETVRSALWTEDESRVLTLADDGMLRVFAAPSQGQPLRLRGHESYVYGVGFAPDSRRLASVAWDGSLRTWDSWEGRPLAVHPLGHRIGAALSRHPDGRRVAVLHHGGVDLMDLESGETLAEFDAAGSDDIALSSSGRFVALGHSPGRMSVRNLALDEELASAACETGNARVSVSFSPDESAVFVACGAELRCVSLDGSESGWQIDDAADTLFRVAVSPDGSIVAASGRTGLVAAWDARDGTLLWRTRSPGAPAYAIAFHPSGAPLVTGSQDGVVRAWHIGEEEPLAELRCHDDYVYDLAFSPDGDLLASASADATICLWDRKSRAERAASVAR